MYAIFYSKIVEQVNVVRKYAPIPTDNFSIKLARPHDMAFPWQQKETIWQLSSVGEAKSITTSL